MAYKGWYWDWIEQWSQFFRRDNWYMFQPILIEYDDDRIMGGLEITIVILGLGFRCRWNYHETDEVKDIKRRIDKIVNDFSKSS